MWSFLFWEKIKLTLEGHPLTSLVQYAHDSFLVPGDDAPFARNEGGTGAGHFLVGGRLVEAPGGVYLPVGAADGTLVPEAHASRYLLVGHSLRKHPGDRLLVRFKQFHRRLLVLVPDFVHTRFD